MIGCSLVGSWRIVTVVVTSDEITGLSRQIYTKGLPPQPQDFMDSFVGRRRVDGICGLCFASYNGYHD